MQKFYCKFRIFISCRIFSIVGFYLLSATTFTNFKQIIYYCYIIILLLNFIPQL